MKWFIRPRRAGKTFDTITWWLEDPMNRVIVTPNDVMAKVVRDTIARWMPGRFTRDELSRAVYSFRQANARLTGRHQVEIAIDNVDHILPSLFPGHEVTLVTGTTEQSSRGVV